MLIPARAVQALSPHRVIRMAWPVKASDEQSRSPEVSQKSLNVEFQT
jgi:hypothetical protein